MAPELIWAEHQLEPENREVFGSGQFKLELLYCHLHQSTRAILWLHRACVSIDEAGKKFVITMLHVPLT